MKTSIEIIVDKNSNKIHFCTTNVEINDSPIDNKNLANIAKQKGFINATIDFFKSLVYDYNKDNPENQIINIYPHNSILEIDFKPKSIREYEVPTDKKPLYKGVNFRQYVFNEGELKDVPSEILTEAKQIRDSFVKWFNKYTDNKVKIKEDLDFLTDMIYVNIIPEENKVWFSTENSSGAEYDCYSKEDLVNAFKAYIDMYI